MYMQNIKLINILKSFKKINFTNVKRQCYHFKTVYKLFKNVFFIQMKINFIAQRCDFFDGFYCTRI